jgi:hypothetical protein
MDKGDLFKLAVLNELLGEELHKVPTDTMLDNAFICKIKNARKATNSLTNSFDFMFGFKTAEVFGNFCEEINKAVDDAIKFIDESDD